MLPKTSVPAAAATEAAQPLSELSRRELVVLDLREVQPERVAAVLGLAGFDTAQLLRRGGFHLHRIVDGEAARAEQDRLREAGVPAFLVREAEARVQPLVALRGRYEAGVLFVRHAEGELSLSASDLLLAVQGPILREHQRKSQGGAELKRMRTASLEPGYRFHLHRRVDPRPLELDPASFAFALGTVGGSALLSLRSWVLELLAGGLADDGFRRLPPALAPTTEEQDAGLGGASRLRRRRGRDVEAPLILDNLAQFRFYSAWRGAIERGRRH
jgi:hypothetical protein